MSTHSKAAKRFVADAERLAWHDRALYAVRGKRDRMMETVPEWEELRRLSSEIKLHTLSRLGDYLCEFERNATANGMQVHWAADAAEMNETVWELIRRHGGRRRQTQQHHQDQQQNHDNEQRRESQRHAQRPPGPPPGFALRAARQMPLVKGHQNIYEIRHRRAQNQRHGR